MSSLEKFLFKSFANFLMGLLVFLEWSRVSSLYILEIKPLSEVSLANMFSHTVGSLFILMLFSLAVQKLFILIRSHLFILSFRSLALGDILVKILLHGISEIFLLMFSSRTFIVSLLIFKSFIHENVGLQWVFVRKKILIHIPRGSAQLVVVRAKYATRLSPLVSFKCQMPSLRCEYTL